MTAEPDDPRLTARSARAAFLGALERNDHIARRVLTRMEVWCVAHRLDRSVLVVDDSPPALAALVASLMPLGVPVHAVTNDPDVAAWITAEGASAHRVTNFCEAAAVWARVRSAVVVVDWHLSQGVTAGDVLDAIGRGPRAVIVTSRDGTRDTIPEMARLTQATSVFRSGGTESMDRVREAVRALLDEATPGGCA